MCIRNEGNFCATISFGAGYWLDLSVRNGLRKISRVGNEVGIGGTRNYLRFLAGKPHIFI
jgi:hypothetical protein